MAEPTTDFKRTASRGAYAAGMQQAVKITLQILSAVVMSRR